MSEHLIKSVGITMNAVEAINKEKTIFQEQEDQYEYPYHYTPYFMADGSAIRTRHLNWGFDYLACLKHAKDTIESHKPTSLLEVGCGDGAIIGAFSKNIKRRVGVDLAEQAIKFAQAFHKDIEFLAQDAKLLDETFNAVMAIEVLEHIPDPQVSSFLKTLETRTKKGGVIYISVPSINLPLYSKHYRHYSPDLLQKQISDAGLSVEISELRYFRSPVRFEKFYQRLTDNRLFVGDIHPLRRAIWKKVESTLNDADHKTTQHVIAVLKKT